MTKLLSKVIRQIEELPEERQDDVARMMLAILENDAGHQLSDEQLRDLDERIADVEAGNFARDTDIEAALYRPWA